MPHSTTDTHEFMQEAADECAFIDSGLGACCSAGEHQFELA
jgi:hypothetical protein